MSEIEYKKSLIGEEDLLLGFGIVNQTRGGSTLPINKINSDTIPHNIAMSIKDKLDNIDTSLDLRNSVSRNTIADLKLETGIVFNTINVLGYYTPGDGGGGTFYWDSTSTEPDNGGTIIQPTGINIGRWKRVFSSAVNVKWFGAVGDGVTDDTVAIQKAFATGKNIIYGRYTYKIRDSIPVASNITVDSYGAIINWTGLSTVPLYTITAPASEININGGLYTGTPSAWLLATGVSSHPSSITDYARFSIKDLEVSGANIFINAQKAARFRVHNVLAYVANGINCFGKIVEMFISDSMFFGSNGTANTYGINLEAYTGDTDIYYPEGLMLSNCGFDNFHRALRFIDIFQAGITNCWISGAESIDSNPIYIKRGNTTHCQEIIFNGNTISGGILFDTSTTGVDYHVTISNNQFINSVGNSIYLGGNTYYVSITGNKFDAPIGSVIAVFAENNVGNITFEGNTVNRSYLRMFQSTGANGADINICNNYGDLAQSTYLSRPAKIRNTGTDNDILKVQLTGTVTSGNYWGNSISVSYTKGEKFLLIINGGFSTTTTGYLVAEMPAGLITPNGSGWDDGFMYIGGNPNYTKVSRVIPIYASSNWSGAIRLKNNNITSVDTYYNCTMSLVKI